MRRMHRLKGLLVLCLLFCFPAQAESDLYNEAWFRQLGGDGADVLVDFVERPEGGLYLVGSATSSADNARGGIDAWAVCLDEDGEPLWEHRMGGKGEDRFTRVVALAEGGAIFLGYSHSEDGDLESIRHGRGQRSAWVVRVSDQGEILWQKMLGGQQNDELLDLHVSNETILLCGRTQSYKIDLRSNGGGYDAWACAIALDTGASLWHYRYGGTGDELFDHVLPDDDGWMFLGEQTILDASDPNALEPVEATTPVLVALDTEGNEYGVYPVSDIASTKISYAWRVDNGWMLAGQTTIAGGEAWFGHLSSSGSLLWHAWFSGNQGSHAVALYPYSDIYIMLGVTSAEGGEVPGVHGGQDIWVVARDESRPLIWQQALGGSGDAWPIGLTRLNDGTYLIAGVTTSHDGDLTPHHAKRAGWLVQLASNGNLTWSKLLAPSEDQVIVDMIMDHDEAIYLLGTVYGETEDEAKAWIVKMVPGY